MYREKIVWKSVPSEIQLRSGRSATQEPPQPVPELVKPASVPVAASFPNTQGQPVSTAPPPPPDLRPLLEQIAGTLGALDARRQQSLAEMQQAALELAISVASNLVFEAISSDQFAVERLVSEAVRNMELDSAPTVWLHPKDLELLQKRLAKEPPPWEPGQVQLRSDPAVGRGGCRVEEETGRVRVSDISLRLSEIRRHWLEELDDSQVERRRTQEESRNLRRFPDRRETA